MEFVSVIYALRAAEYAKVCRYTEYMRPPGPYERRGKNEMGKEKSLRG